MRVIAAAILQAGDGIIKPARDITDLTTIDQHILALIAERPKQRDRCRRCPYPTFP